MKLQIWSGALSIAAVVFALGCDLNTEPLAGTTMEAVTDDTVSATVGTGLTGVAAPRVRVLDQNGDPIASVVVSWAVTAGGGTVQRSSQPTDSNGVSNVGRWTLGTTSGVQTLRASIAPPPGTDAVAPIVFTALAHSAAPVSMSIAAGSTQNWVAGLQVPIRPAVRMVDQFGNPATDVPVLFEVVQGGGLVINGSQTSSPNGIASVGAWVLGAPGQNILRATVDNLGIIQFTANANSSPGCLVHASYAFATIQQGNLENTDCLAGGKRLDFYDVINPAAQAIRFEQTSTAFAPQIFLYDAQGNTLAQDIVTNGTGTGLTASSFTILTPPASFVVGASSFETQKTGVYSITSTVVSPAVENCRPMFVRPGIVTTQNLVTSDCQVTGPYYLERYHVSMLAGQQLVVEMSSTAFRPYLEMQAFDGTLLQSSEGSQTNTSAELTFTAFTSGYFTIMVSSQLTSATGAYTLTVSPP